MTTTLVYDMEKFFADPEYLYRFLKILRSLPDNRSITIKLKHDNDNMSYPNINKKQAEIIIDGMIRRIPDKYSL